MNLWMATLAEASASATWVLAAGILLVALAVRTLAPGERARLRFVLVLLGLHAVLLPVAAHLRVHGSDGYVEVRLAGAVFALVAAIQVLAACTFGVLVPRLGLRAPGILRDVLVAGASLIAFFVLASRAGLNLSGLIATSTVLTAVVGLSLQDTLGNVMAGLALQVDESVRVGEWLKVGDWTGRVTEIRWRSTSLETRNWETLVVPNSVLVRQPFLVLGRRQGQPELWRRWVYFNVDFRTPPTEVIAAVEAQLRAAPIPGVAAEPRPQCLLVDLFDSYGRYAARYWLADLSVDDPTDSVVRTRVFFALKRAGIALSIPAQAVFVTEESAARRQRKESDDLRRRMQALARVEMFTHFSDDDRRTLAARLHEAPFAAGEIVTRQGAQAHWLYLIREGEACVRVRGEGGQEREVARLLGGDFFGEMSLMTGAPRAATVVAISDVVCYRLDKQAFQHVLRQRPELAEQVADTLAHRTVALQAVKQELDDEGRRQQVADTRRDLLDKIRAFFGLDEDESSTL